MPDAQGTASFIGEFMKGFMGQVAQAEQKKVRDVAGLMDVAEQYRRMAEQAPTEEGYYSAQENYLKKVSEADKLMNEKVSGLGTIMGLFGFGKKGKDGQPGAGIPRQWFQPQPSTSEAPTTPAAMPRPAFMGPEPTYPREEELPAEFRGPMRQFITQPSDRPAPVAPAAAAAGTPAAPVSEYAGLPYIRQQMLRVEDARAERARQEQLELEKQKAEINRGFGREDYAWRQGQTEAETQRKLQAYRASPNYGKDPQEDARMESFIQFGTPYREPSLRTSTAITRNAAGDLVRRTTDLRTGEAIHEEPYYQPADEPLIQAIIQEAVSKNISMTPEQAQEELGRRRLESMSLAQQAKKAGIANQAALLAARNLRNEMQQKAQAGGLTTKDAKSLYQAAMTYAKSIVTGLAQYEDAPESKIMEASIPIAIKWIEEAGLSWPKIQSLLSGTPTRSPMEETKGYRPPQARTPAPTYNFPK